MLYSFADVVLVPFPFTDQSGIKKRPAVGVSSSGYNTHGRDLIIMAITSQIRQSLSFGEAWVVDWQNAGLIKPLVFKPVFTTIEQALIVRTMGVLSAADQNTLRSILSCVIA